MFVMRAEFLVAWGTAIPVAWVGARVLEDAPLVGVWCGWAAYTVGWAVAMHRRFRTDRWQSIRL